MKDKIITAILVLIVGLFLLPLAKFNDQQDTQELKGFSARDIQYIESVGFIDNNNGSWTLTLSALPSNNNFYVFDYQPLGISGKITHFKSNGGAQAFVIYYGVNISIISGGTFTIWGGDVS